MSIILKGIDLPKKGETLILKIKDSRIYREYPRYKFQPTRIKDGEAIQIPKNHGRLIDMDASMVFHGFDKEYFEECKRKIFEGHGILEAEE